MLIPVKLPSLSAVSLPWFSFPHLLEQQAITDLGHAGRVPKTSSPPEDPIHSEKRQITGKQRYAGRRNFACFRGRYGAMFGGKLGQKFMFLRCYEVAKVGKRRY